MVDLRYISLGPYYVTVYKHKEALLSPIRLCARFYRDLKAFTYMRQSKLLVVIILFRGLFRNITAHLPFYQDIRKRLTMVKRDVIILNIRS